MATAGLILLGGLFIAAPASEIWEVYDQPWQVSSFIEDAGLSHRFIYGIDFEKNGTVWIASADGLYRYDGYRWQRFNSGDGLPSNFIRCVFVDREGALWVGSDRGAGVYDYRTGRYQSYGSEKGFPGSSVRRISQDPDGTFWFCCDRWPDPKQPGGLTCFQKGVWKRYSPRDGLPSDHLVSYFRDSKGRQFVTTSLGIAQKRGERWGPLENPGFPPNLFVWSMAEGPDGRLFSYGGNHLFVLENNRWKKFSSAPANLCLTREGELVSTISDSSRFLFSFTLWDGKQFVRASAGVPRLQDTMIEMVAEAPDGAIWAVGLNTLMRWHYRAEKWKYYPQLPTPTLVDGKGSIWFAGAGAVWVLRDGRFHRVENPVGPLFPGPGGAVFMSTQGNLVRTDGAAKKQVWVPDQTGIHQFAGGTLDKQGVAWFFGQDRLGKGVISFLAEGRWNQVSLPLLGPKVIHRLFPDWKEGIWAVLVERMEKKSQLIHLHANQSESPLIECPSQLAYPFLASDPFGLWLYAFKGIFHSPADGPVKWVEVANFSHQGYISHHATSRGSFFFFNGSMSGKPGVVFFNEGRWEELDANLNGVFSACPDGEVDFLDYGGFYRYTPGISLSQMPYLKLPGIPAPLQGVIKEKEGIYWIGTSSGVFRYQQDRTPPEGEIQADSSVIPRDGTLKVRISAIERYSTLARGEFCQFSSRIDSQPWSAIQRGNTLDLAGATLVPGEHLLQVQVRDPFGAVDPTSAEFRFRVAPLPVQARPWFKPAVGLIAVLMILLAWISISRARLISAANRQLREDVRERQKAQNTLALSNEILEQRVNERTAEFLTANRSLSAEVAERRKFETALSESEQRYRLLVENQGEGIVLADLQENILFANPAAERIFGVPTGTLCGRSLLEFLDEEGRQRVAAETARRAAGQATSYDLEILRAGGEKRWLLLTAVPQVNAEGAITGVLGVFRDNTERRLLEEQLVQSQKMESVGRLAGGVAHDFNNLLTVINGHTSLLLQELDLDNPLCESLEAIQTAGDKASHLTRQLLAFSRKQVLMPRVFNLNDLVRENTKMLRRLIEENIDLQLFLAKDLKNVKADPGQMEQVLMNLAINARDAMPEGGKLTLETKNLVLTEEYCRTHAVVVPGSYVLLAVSDTGRGIEPQIQPHIFEPFFTTKEKGQGTGLGLSMVYGIVKQSGGYIWVYSEPGQGTTFKIYLPVCEIAGESHAEPPEESEPVVETKTILVAEDDEMVRSLTCLGLRKYGFIVLEAVDTREAIAQGADFPGQIDLLLTDVVMPQMSGHQLAEKILQLRPGIKVLYMSGYTDNAIVHHGVLDPGLEFLQKPFSPKMLTQKIRSILRNSS